MAHRVIVIGGANADIGGVPSDNLILKDSNPGKITLSPGGVARNISFELRKMGVEVSLITATGDDAFGSFIRDNCSGAGIDISMSRICSGHSSSLYMYINDSSNDMLVAINDMDIVNEITPEYLEEYLDKINSFDLCCIDANLSQNTIEYLADNVIIPIFADPVSTAKAVKLKPVLDRLLAVKPNQFEMDVLSPCPCLCFESLGSSGMNVYDGSVCYHIDAPDVKVSCTTGCGDCACAALICGYLDGMTPSEAASFAVRAASEKASGS